MSAPGTRAITLARELAEKVPNWLISVSVGASLVTVFATIWLVSATMETGPLWREVVADVPEKYSALFHGGSIQAADVAYDAIGLVRHDWNDEVDTFEDYGVVFHSDGSAELRSTCGLEFDGDFVGTIRSAEFGRLCYLVEKSGFSSLESCYWRKIMPEMKKENYEAIQTQGIYVVVSSHSGRKTVFDRDHAAPIELWAIEKVLDEIRTNVQWKSK